jgi:hypothetical protein
VSARLSRFPRKLVVLAALPAVGLSLPLGALLTASDEAPASSVVVRGPAPGIEARADVPRAPELRALQATASDRTRSLAERGDALQQLARESHDARPLLAVLRGLASDDPHRRPLADAALLALARFPSDPGARARLLESLSLDAPRGERLLALSTLQSLPDNAWCRPYVAALASDPDPQVRERAAWAEGRSRQDGAEAEASDTAPRRPPG